MEAEREIYDKIVADLSLRKGDGYDEFIDMLYEAVGDISWTFVRAPDVVLDVINTVLTIFGYFPLTEFYPDNARALIITLTSESDKVLDYLQTNQSNVRNRVATKVIELVTGEVYPLITVNGLLHLRVREIVQLVELVNVHLRRIN